MVKIQDIYGKDYDIPDLESFVSHIKKYHTINGIPDDSVHAVSYTHLTLPTKALV